MFVQTDPYISTLISGLQQYMDTANQRSSLSEIYKQLQAESGVEALDMEMLDLKNVIDGNEEMLRDEITKAGGFATEGQIQNLTNSRNRQLVKNFNKLLDLRNSKEKYLQTAIGLEAQDRQSADQRFNNIFNMSMQIADYQKKMQTNAVERMKWNVDKMGFDGLYDATGGDPYKIDLVEQTLGIPQDSLAQVANQARQAKFQAQQQQKLDLQLKRQQLITPEEKALDIKYRQAQLNKLNADTKKIYSDMADEASDTKKLSATQYQALGYGSRLVQSGNIINEIGNQFASKFAPNFSLFGLNLVPGFLKSADQKQYEQAKKNFVNAVLRRESGAAISQEEFESAEAQYFPKLGDDETTLQQKLENRNLVSANFLREGGMDTVDPTKLTVSPTGELIELLD